MSQLNELKEKLGLSNKTVDEVYVNPLRLAISEEFGAPGAKGDYRDRAIDRCIKAEVSFESECNSIKEVLERVVQVINPVTKKPMKFSGGGGGGEGMTLTFTDKTGIHVHISVPNDAIRVSFPEKKK